MGGCLLADNLSWAGQMFTRNSLPPDPRHVGERWRDLWFQRLEHTGHWLEAWLEHQHRDAYWRHGSVCEDYGRVRCPVYAVSGWVDGYCNAVFRVLAGLDVPRKGLVGPWAHQYPDAGRPGPAIDFINECLRWWDHWLKERDTGIMDEPMLHAWIQDSAPPRGAYVERPGRWAAEPYWPSPNVAPETCGLGADGSLLLGEAAADADVHTICSPLTTGRHAGKWCSYAVPGDLPVDQRSDDARSLVFETPPLTEPLDMLGAAVAELEIEVDRPTAQVAVRINDVAPDGAVTRVTYGLLNLTHRDSHAEPVPLEPGRVYRVRVPLKHVGQRFFPGHRLRLAVSTCYWPLAWPSPEPVTLRVHTAGSHLELPLRPIQDEDETTTPFASPPAKAAAPHTVIEPPANGWQLHEDLASGEHSLEVRDGTGTFRIEQSGLTVSRTGKELYRCVEGDWASPSGEIQWRASLARGDWSIMTMTETALTADAEYFHLKASLKAYENEELCYEANWSRRIPRDQV